MLEHVSGINRVHGIGRIGQSVAHVEPRVDFMERIAVDVYEAGQVVRAASQVEMAATISRMPAVQKFANNVIRESGLRNAPKHNVFQSLVKQPILRLSSGYCKPLSESTADRKQLELLPRCRLHSQSAPALGPQRIDQTGVHEAIFRGGIVGLYFLTPDQV